MWRAADGGLEACRRILGRRPCVDPSFPSSGVHPRVCGGTAVAVVGRKDLTNDTFIRP